MTITAVVHSRASPKSQCAEAIAIQKLTAIAMSFGL